MWFLPLLVTYAAVAEVSGESTSTASSLPVEDFTPYLSSFISRDDSTEYSVDREAPYNFLGFSRIKRSDPCYSKSDCPDHLTCQRRECIDPCKWCGDNTDCEVENHIATCTCTPGYEGEPQAGCTKSVIDGMCANAQCGTHEHCPSNSSCVMGKCRDSCQDQCGANTICQVINHLPTCGCMEGYAGNPIAGCSAQGCPGKWPPSQRGKKKFEVENVNVATWAEALMICMRENKQLATIDSREELEEIRTNIRKTGRRSGNFWTAGTDYARESNWIWVTTENEVSSHVAEWNVGQPDNWANIEHCLELWEADLSRGYLWNDRYCHEKHYYICEYYE